MLNVTIFHSPFDRQVAGTIAARLERGAEARVWLEECDKEGGQTIPAAVEGGLSGAAALLLLSPAAVPERSSRNHWEAVLKHVESNAAPPLGAVLVSDCAYPRLLERNRFFLWRDGPKKTLRAIERWVLSLRPEGDRPSFAPAGLLWFAGRRQELDELWDALVDEAGVVVLANPTAASGKTSLAQEFARMARGHFRDILWVPCTGRSPAAIVGELGSQLRVPLNGSFEEAAGRVWNVIGRHRVLVVLDDATSGAGVMAQTEGYASLLVTTRCAQIELPANARVLWIDSVPLPVLAELPGDSVDQRLWFAMSVCRPGVFPLELAAQIAELDEAAARDACNRLLESRWIDPFDTEGKRFRLGAGSMIARPAGEHEESLRRRRAEALVEVFAAWRTHPDRCEDYIAEFEEGFRWALRADWPLANKMAERACAFFKARERWPEAAEVYLRLREAAVEWQDSRVIENCSWELSWLHDERGGIRRPPCPGDQLAFDWAAGA